MSDNNWLLSVAVGADKAMAEQAYDIPKVAMNVDFINLMTYDFTEVGLLSHNAPLYGSDDNNVDSTIRDWLNKGNILFYIRLYYD